VDNYVDDCIVFSDNMQSHIQDLRLQVLGRLQVAGFTLRGSKCSFGHSSVSHLGFNYSSSGITPATDKTHAIINWTVPTSAKEVQSFLGLANFYCRFIPQFADVAAPLTALTGSRTPLKWKQAQQSAFTALQQALISPRVLDYPQPDDHFILTTDASDVGLGAVLSTEQGSVVEFASQTLTAAEQRYMTTEKECLAILWAIRKFHHYLIGAHFTLETDHKPLEWLESSHKSQACSQHLERWSLELRAYDFTVVHRPGKYNQTADALSRHPVNLVASNTPLDLQQLSNAQHNDSVPPPVIDQLKSTVLAFGLDSLTNATGNSGLNLYYRTPYVCTPLPWTLPKS